MTCGVNEPTPAKGESFEGVPMGIPLAWSALAACRAGSGNSSVVEKPVTGSATLPWALSEGYEPRWIMVIPPSGA